MRLDMRRIFFDHALNLHSISSKIFNNFATYA